MAATRAGPVRLGMLLAVVLLASGAGSTPSAPGRAAAPEVAGRTSPGASAPDRTPVQRRTLALLDSLWAAGRTDTLWTCAEAALRTARVRGDARLTLDLLATRGRMRASLGLIAESEPDLRAAIRMARSAGDDSTLRASLRWLAYALDREGRNDEALRAWQRLRAHSERAGDLVHQAWAWSGIGFLRWQSGDPRAAESADLRALGLFRAAHDERGEAFVLNALGVVANAQGDYLRADQRFRLAAAKADRARWTWLAAVAWNNVASLEQSLGDPGRARTLYVKAAELHRRAGDLAEALVTGENVARCDAALGAYDEAAAELELLFRECREHGIAHLEGGLRNALADVRTRQGRPHAAARLYRANLERGASITADAHQEAVLGLARTLAAVDSVPAGLALMRRESSWIRTAADAIGRAECDEELGDLLLRAGRPQEALRVLLSAAAEARRLGVGAPRIRALAGAARAAERLGMRDRALALLREALGVWEVERGLPADPEWREVRGVVAADVVASLGRLLLVLPPDASPAERARHAFDAVQAFKARTLMERMLGPARGDTSSPAAIPTTCTELQRRVLRPGELMLDFYLGADSGLVFVVSREECRAYRIPPRRELESVLAPYSRAVAAADGSAEPARGRDAGLALAHRSVRELLLGPALDRIARSRSLIVVPDGILDRLSFAALLDDPSPDPAARRLALQTVPSASILARLRATLADRPAWVRDGPSILALAGGRDASGNRLSGALGEVRDLASDFRRVSLALPGTPSPPRAGPVDSIRAAELRGTALLERAAGYDVLHFAAHTTIDEQRPWRSSLRLGDETDPGRLLRLTGSAIARSTLSARLVVLSTCRSADGRLLPGEGVQGPAAAFLVAGVPAVVAALWPVQDADARWMMRRLYLHLAEGATVGEALSLAQSDARRTAERFRSARWAGYVVVGDGDLRIPIRRRTLAERFGLPAALLLFGCAAVLGWLLRPPDIKRECDSREPSAFP